MLSFEETSHLTRQPSALNVYTVQHPNWLEALRFVADLPSDVARVLNRHYHGLDKLYRPMAADVLVHSIHRNGVRLPDAIYVNKWMERAFDDGCFHLDSENDTPSLAQMGYHQTSVLSAWLDGNRDIARSLAFLVSIGMKRSGAFKRKPSEMQALLENVVARKWRTPSFYQHLLEHLPTALVVAAKHLNENDCLMQMGSLHCQYAAQLPHQWHSVYPGSAQVTTISQVLTALHALGHYDADALRQSAGLAPEGPTVCLPLPPEFALV